jgi:hypothetical protein
MKIHFFIEDTHLGPTPKDFQMHQQSLDHSYCKRETSWTKIKNSQSVMISVVRIGQLTDKKIPTAPGAAKSYPTRTPITELPVDHRPPVRECVGPTIHWPM